MKERPMLMSAPMVRAILENRKTQTRRVIKDTGFFAIDEKYHGAESSRREREALAHSCPYGVIGDRLWVRETFAYVGATDPGYLVYRATYPTCLPLNVENIPADIRDVGEKWRPSIHMPRAASRITLEITGVRVERLQDISASDVLKEGCCPSHICGGERDVLRDEFFRPLWESINGAGSWEVNPWVWVIEFKRVTNAN